LRQDNPPDLLHLPGLRRLLRSLIAEHLGGRDLQSWGLIAELDALVCIRHEISSGSGVA
jgi:hypothetical protein